MHGSGPLCKCDRRDGRCHYGKQCDEVATIEGLCKFCRHDKELDRRHLIYAELRTQTDRGAAIIGAALVEEALRRALQSKLQIKVNPNIKQRLFEANGPLATFSAKIDLAYSLQLVDLDESQYRDLHLIRKVRNEFAHAVEPITFDSQKVKNLCAEFRYIEETANRYPYLDTGAVPPKEPRERYLWTVSALSLQVFYE
jgi:hypothetical protein